MNEPGITIYVDFRDFMQLYNIISFHFLIHIFRKYNSFLTTGNFYDAFTQSTSFIYWQYAYAIAYNFEIRK